MGVASYGTGFSVRSAADGRRGPEAFDEERPDAVVLDLMLPEVDGLEVCRRLRDSSSVPIVIQSARDDTTDVMRPRSCGCR